MQCVALARYSRILCRSSVGNQFKFVRANHNAVENNSKLNGIVDSIGNLSVLELVSLNKIIKEKFNIADTPVVFPTNAIVAPQAEAQETKEKEPEKLSFSVKVDSYDTDKRVALIKAVREVLPELNLVEAKKFVESLPKTTHQNIKKDDAEAIKAKLESAGAKVSLV